MSTIYVVTRWTEEETTVEAAFTQKEFAEAAVKQNQYNSELEAARADHFPSVAEWKKSESYYDVFEYISWTIDEIDVVM